MTDSRALGVFRDALAVAEALLDHEGTLPEPPPDDKKRFVEGLKGGAAVLMVAAFENFLRESFEERLSLLAVDPPPIAFDDLPEKLRVSTVYSSFEWAERGPPGRGKPARIPAFTDAARHLVAGKIHPTSLAQTQNPSPDAVREMFSAIGLADVLGAVRPDFDRKWSKAEAATFVHDKLREVVDRRHVVAHTAATLRLARGELREGLTFLRTLAECLDGCLEKHVADVIARRV